MFIFSLIALPHNLLIVVSFGLHLPLSSLSLSLILNLGLSLGSAHTHSHLSKYSHNSLFGLQDKKQCSSNFVLQTLSSLISLHSHQGCLCPSIPNL